MEHHTRLLREYWVLENFDTHDITYNQLNTGCKFLLQYDLKRREGLIFVSGFDLIVINDEKKDYNNLQNNDLS